jgi:hypothetical protein
MDLEWPKEGYWKLEGVKEGRRKWKALTEIEGRCRE